MNDRVYYAIGDVHGEAERLSHLHALVFEDAARLGVAPFLIQVGDLVDRGPDSRSVVARMMQLESNGFDSIVIMGNHEELMLTAYDRPEGTDLYHWKTNGGDTTIASYEAVNGVQDDWRQSIDRGHIAWVRALPSIWRDESRGLVFVHGGINPREFPNCSGEVRRWTRTSAFFDSDDWPERPELENILVVHGHTPTESQTPDVQRRRINVDTGVCYGGPLTCVVLAPGEAPRFLKA